jgi:tetratricopeptide (TPR) repeat protein
MISTFLSAAGNPFIDKNDSIDKSFFTSNALSEREISKVSSRSYSYNTKDETVELYNKAIVKAIEEQDTKFLSLLLFNKGLYLLRADMNNEAHKSFSQALDLATKTVPLDLCLVADIANNQAITSFKLGKFIEADAWLTLALGLAGATQYSLDLLNNKGLALYATGKYHEAIENYDKALKINPNYADALNNKGNALLQLGKAEEAIDYYKRAYQLYKSQPNNDNQSSCPTHKFRSKLTLKGYLESGFSDYFDGHGTPIYTYFYIKEIQNHSPILPLHFSNISPFYDISLENKGKIKELLSLTNQGIALALQNKYDDALTIFDAVLVMDPNFGPALYNKADVLEKSGKDASEYYKRAENNLPDYQGGNIGISETQASQDTGEGLLVIIGKKVVSVVSTFN